MRHNGKLEAGFGILFVVSICAKGNYRQRDVRRMKGRTDQVGQLLHIIISIEPSQLDKEDSIPRPKIIT
jgi:hypothetical protein